MSDDDKTVFKSGQPGQDKTIVMPRPGSRAPSAAPPSAPQPAPSINTSPTVGASSSPPRVTVRTVAPPVMANTGPVSIEGGLNPLAAAASVLLTVSHGLRAIVEHDDVTGLQRQLIDELKQFENQARAREVVDEQVNTARYLLCTMLDEFVLGTPWGARSRWGQHSLLSQFYNETSGGENCFAMLQRMLEAPAEYLDVLELFYLCVSLGFEGKYKLDPQGREHLEHIGNSLFQTIRNYRGEFEPDLSPDWQSEEVPQRSLLHYAPLWVVASCAMLILVVVFSGFRVWLYQVTEPTVEHLDQLVTIERDESSQ